MFGFFHLSCFLLGGVEFKMVDLHNKKKTARVNEKFGRCFLKMETSLCTTTVLREFMLTMYLGTAYRDYLICFDHRFNLGTVCRAQHLCTVRHA